MSAVQSTTSRHIDEDSGIAASDQQELTSIPATPTNADDISLLEDDIAIRSRVQGVASGVTQQHRRKRLKADFPWSYTRDWVTGDSLIALGKRQCRQCKKWFSSSTNAQGCKAHLLAQHGIKKPSEDKDSSSTRLSSPGGGG